jgi:uncharacterized phiE125 gp8 family phage protein
MTSVMGPEALAAAVVEAKAYLRVVGSDEDALIERLAGSAAALCEAFTGRWLMTRAGTETVSAKPCWQRLRAAPVSAILGVDRMAADGAATALPAEAYEIDIDAAGAGWVLIRSPGASGVPGTGARRARVRFEAGMAAEWTDLPEPLRQGIVRITAHLYIHRSAEGGAGPPAAVTALWRPWRRLGIGFEGRAHV